MKIVHSNLRKSLKELSRKTESYLVLRAIHQVLLLNDDNMLVKEYLPSNYKVDLTFEELLPEYKRVEDLKKLRRKAL